MSSNLSPAENAALGAAVGIIEVLSLQSFNYFKNMKQQMRTPSMDPRVWYRGVSANVVNMGSCTMLQFVVGGEVKTLLAGDSHTNLTPGQEMTAGLAAGMTSAVIGSPLELAMVQKQNHGSSFKISSILNANITRGFIGASIREGLWTVGYLSIPPIVRSELRTQFPDVFTSDAKALLPASLFGAAFACYLTQPVDTIKTCMQGDIERKKFTTFTGTAKKIWAEKGLMGFYAGSSFRYGRMVIAVSMMDTLRSWLGPLMFPAKY